MWWLHKIIFRGENSLILLILHKFSIMLIQMYFLGYCLEQKARPFLQNHYLSLLTICTFRFLIRHVSKLSPLVLLLIVQTGHFSRRWTLLSTTAFIHNKPQCWGTVAATKSCCCLQQAISLKQTVLSWQYISCHMEVNGVIVYSFLNIFAWAFLFFNKSYLLLEKLCKENI